MSFQISVRTQRTQLKLYHILEQIIQSPARIHREILSGQ